MLPDTYPTAYIWDDSDVSVVDAIWAELSEYGRTGGYYIDDLRKVKLKLMADDEGVSLKFAHTKAPDPLYPRISLRKVK